MDSSNILYGRVYSVFNGLKNMLEALNLGTSLLDSNVAAYDCRTPFQ